MLLGGLPRRQGGVEERASHTSGLAVLVALAMAAVLPTPSMAAHPLCGVSLTQDTTLTEDIDCSEITTTVITLATPNIRFDGGGHQILAPNAAVVVLVSASNVRVTSLDISLSSGTPAGTGVRLDNVSGCEVDRIDARRRATGVHVESGGNHYVHDVNASDPAQRKTGSAFTIYDSPGNTFERCDGSFRNIGIEAYGSQGRDRLSNQTIRNNRLASCATAGIRIRPAAPNPGEVQNALISNNVLSQCGGYAIDLGAIGRVTITTDNDLTGCAHGVKICADTTIQNWDMTRYGIAGEAIRIEGTQNNGGGNCVIRNVQAQDLQQRKSGSSFVIYDAPGNTIENCNGSFRDIGIHVFGTQGKDKLGNQTIRNNTLVSCGSFGIRIQPSSPVARSIRRFVLAGNDLSSAGQWGVFADRCSDFEIGPTNVFSNCANGLAIGAPAVIRDLDMSEAGIPGTAIRITDFYAEAGVEITRVNISRPARDGLGVGLDLVNVLGPKVEQVIATGRNVGIQHSLSSGLSSRFGSYIGNDVSFCREAGIQLTGANSTALHLAYTVAGNRAVQCGNTSTIEGWGLSLRNSDAFTITSSNTVAGSANGIVIGANTALDGWRDNLSQIPGTAVQIVGPRTRVTSANVSFTSFPGQLRLGIGIDIVGGGGSPDIEIRNVKADSRFIAVSAANAPGLRISECSLRDSVRGVSLSNSPGAILYHNNFSTNPILPNPVGVSCDASLELSAIPPSGGTTHGNYWSHPCPVLFAAGADTNSTNVIDSFPFERASGWSLGDRPGCGGALNHAPTLAPIANPAAPIVFSRVVLNAQPADVDGDPLAITWTQVSGATVALEQPRSPSTGFTPESTGLLGFRVIASDSRGAVTSATLTVGVQPDITPPEATLVLAPDSPIASDGLVLLFVTFTEPILGEPRIDFALQSGTVPLPGGILVPTGTRNQYTYSFNATPGLRGRYRATLSARDRSGNLLAEQPENAVFEVNVPSPNRPPVVDAGTNREVIVGSEVTLNGFASDPDGDTLTINWTREPGAPAIVELTAPSTLQPRFRPPVEGVYQFRLTVADGRNLPVQSLVSVRVLPTPPDLKLLAVSAAQGSFTTGQDLRVTAFVLNATIAPADATEVRFYLSSDRTLSVSRDVSMGSLRVEALGGALGQGITGNVRIPVVPPGSYFLVAKVDPDERILEADEANNSLFASEPTTVVPPIPDDNRANDILTITTAPSIVVDAPRSLRRIEVIGDIDVFAVELEGGQEYLLDTRFPETDFDSLLQLYDASTVPPRPIPLDREDCGDFRARKRYLARRSGLHYLQVQASNSLGLGSYALSVSRIRSLVVGVQRPLPIARVTEPYAVTLTATGGIPPYSWSLASGALPAGVAVVRPATLDGVWKLAGTPNTERSLPLTDQFELLVRDSDCAKPTTAAMAFNIEVQFPTTSAQLFLRRPSGPIRSAIGRQLSQQFVAEGGRLPYTFGLAPDSAALPAGLTILNGKPFSFLFGVPRERVTSREVRLSVLDANRSTATTTVIFDLASPRPPRVVVRPSIPDRGLARFDVGLVEMDDFKFPAGLSIVQFTLAYPKSILEFDDSKPESYPPGELILEAKARRTVQKVVDGILVVTIVPLEGELIRNEGTLLGLRFTRNPSGSGLSLPASTLSLTDIGLADAGGSFVLLPPTASAGVERVVPLRRTARGSLEALIPDPTTPDTLVPFVRLDGRFSVDPNLPRQSLKYVWRAPLGVRLSDPGSATPTFIPATEGVYDFSLTVSNEQFESQTSTVRIIAVGQRSPPTAIAGVRSPVSTFVSTVGDPVRTFPAGLETVALDGTRSSDADPGDGAALAYRWRVVEAPSGFTLPRTDAPIVVLPNVPAGYYELELQVSDTSGLESPVSHIEFLALAAGDAPSVVSIVASASGTSSTAAALPDALVLDPPPPGGRRFVGLTVELPTRVKLQASVADADVGPGKKKLSFEWTTIGDTPRLKFIGTSTTRPDFTRTADLEFEPPVEGQYLLQLTTRKFTDSAEKLVSKVVKRVLVVVNGARRVPVAIASARASTGPRKSTVFAGPRAGITNSVLDVFEGASVELNGAFSPAIGQAPLAYSWVVSDGPRVLFSNPTASVTTFVAPAAPEGTRLLVQLTVDDSRQRSGGSPLRSPPDTIQVNVHPRPPGESIFTLRLQPGVEYVSLPLDPELNGPRDSRSLARRLGAGTLWRPFRKAGTPAATFNLYRADTTDGVFPVGPGEGFVVVTRTGAEVLLAGSEWRLTDRSQQLHPGLNLIGPPQGQATLTARELCDLTGSPFVTTTRPSGEQLVFLKGSSSSADFPLQPGRAYFISVPAARTLVWPEPK